MRAVPTSEGAPRSARHPVGPAVVARAVAEVRDYQQRFQREPATAQVRLGGVPHALVPTEIVAHDLPLALAARGGPEAVALVLYELGLLIGRRHAEAFFEDRAIGEEDMLHRVMTGPAHFAWAGFGDVDLLLMDWGGEDFAVLWESACSFSAQEVGDRVRRCHLQVGYSAGWLGAATCQPLQGRELACRAEGAHRCRFVVGHEERMDRLARDPRMHDEREGYVVLAVHAVRPASDA